MTGKLKQQVLLDMHALADRCVYQEVSRITDAIAVHRVHVWVERHIKHHMKAQLYWALRDWSLR